MVEFTGLKISVDLWDKVALGVPQAPKKSTDNHWLVPVRDVCLL